MSDEANIDTNEKAGAAIKAFDFSYDPHTFKVAATALEHRKTLGLIDEDEMAAILKLGSVGTLATWRSQDSGPPSVKLGKRVFYTQVGLANWINAKIVEQDAAKAALKAAA